MSEPGYYFENKLREKGLKATPERRAVLEHAYGLRGHFDAEDLLHSLQGSGRPISRATVYRTLTHLVDTGLLRRHELGGRRALYEPDYGKRHHEHMICESCGTILEFVQEQIERLQEEECRRRGFLPLSHSLQIRGVCERCQRATADVGERTVTHD